MKAYIISQFGYFPLVWMFHSRGLNKVNSLHERTLSITYGDRSSSFQDLLKKDNSVSVHHRNIQALATEMFKVKNNIAPEIMKQLFAPKMRCYDFRNSNSFKRSRVNSVWHGTGSMSYLGPKIWYLVPSEIKESESLNAFTFKIERWVPEGCSCRSSHQRCSVRKGVLRNFTKFTGKHLCQSLMPATLLKKRLRHRCFPVNFVKFLRTPFSKNTSWRLLLSIQNMQNISWESRVYNNIKNWFLVK